MLCFQQQGSSCVWWVLRASKPRQRACPGSQGSVHVQSELLLSLSTSRSESKQTRCELLAYRYWEIIPGKLLEEHDASMKFFFFCPLSLGLWQSVHIDDLRRSKDMISDMTALQNLTISQLFSEDSCKTKGELPAGCASQCC